MFNERNFFLYYFLVGMIYWSVNIFVRKLHTKNEPGDGWFLSLFWVFGWPICFLCLIVLNGAWLFGQKKRITSF